MVWLWSGPLSPTTQYKLQIAYPSTSYATTTTKKKGKRKKKPIRMEWKSIIFAKEWAECDENRNFTKDQYETMNIRIVFLFAFAFQNQKISLSKRIFFSFFLFFYFAWLAFFPFVTSSTSLPVMKIWSKYNPMKKLCKLHFGLLSVLGAAAARNVFPT